jgi:metal-responsive CopG/Arc/MetJ family transcriptional regulator
MNQKYNMNLGISIPREFIAEIDQAKGAYYSRNKFIFKILKENLSKYREENKPMEVHN